MITNRLRPELFSKKLAQHLRTDAKKLSGILRKNGNWDPEKDSKLLGQTHPTEKVPPERELRILIATDILSEGQNLQDCAIVVNYDLSWAIIRLIQRAGRVDRIGQLSEEIQCYSFFTADGVERIIRLRGRVKRRLRISHQCLTVVAAVLSMLEFTTLVVSFK